MTVQVTPDGRRYLAMAAGTAQPMPFHLRWLLPRLLGSHLIAWVACNALALAALVAGTVALGLRMGLPLRGALVAAALVAGLPWVRFSVRCPVLVDAPALACATWAAALWPEWPALALLAVGAAISEKVPVWVALFAWSPWPLVGLAAPLARVLCVRHGEIDPADPLAVTLRQPLTTGWRSHAHVWRDPWLMLMPWGVCLMVAGSAPSTQLLATLAVAYGQLIVATDTVRLYQQAAPLVAIATASMLPVEWIAPALLAHYMNPWAGKGL